MIEIASMAEITRDSCTEQGGGEIPGFCRGRVENTNLRLRQINIFTSIHLAHVAGAGGALFSSTP